MVRVTQMQGMRETSSRMEVTLQLHPNTLALAWLRKTKSNNKTVASRKEEISCVAVAKQRVRCMAPNVRDRSGMYGSCAWELWNSAALGRLRRVVWLCCSVMVPSPSSMFSGEIDLWMHNALRMSLAYLRLVLACFVMDSYHVAC